MMEDMEKNIINERRLLCSKDPEDGCRSSVASEIKIFNPKQRRTMKHKINKVFFQI